MKVILLVAILLFSVDIACGQDDFYRRNDSLQQLLLQNTSDSIKSGALVELHFLWKNKNYVKSLEYARQAIEFSEKHMPKANTTGIKFMLAFAYMEAGDALRSLEILHSLTAELENSDPSGYSTALAFIAMNYDNQGNYEKALAYQLKASAIFENLTIKDSAFESRPYLGNPHKLATYYLKNNQADSALKYGLIAESRLAQTKLTPWNIFFSWYIKTTLGDIYSELKEYKQALNYYTEAGNEARHNNSLPDLLPVYLSLAKLYYKQKRIDSATGYALKCYWLADTLKILPAVKESTLFLKNVYSSRNKMDSALYFYEIAMAAKDSLFNIDVSRKTDAMEFAAIRKEQETKALKNENALRQRFYYILSGALISIIAALFLYHKNRLKQKANQLLEYEKKEISLQHIQLRREAEGFEMQALKAQMNPHFTFNCINSIDALIQSNDKYNATLYLNKFAKLLRNILDGSKQNTTSLAKDMETLKLYTELEELRNENRFKTDFIIDSELLQGDYIVPPLIIQPFVENAILHGLRYKPGNKGRLTITVKKIEERIQYIIKDNGIGRNEAQKKIQDKESHYGMQMGFDRIKLFNKEKTASVFINDLYHNGNAAGTEVTIILNIV